MGSTSNARNFLKTNHLKRRVVITGVGLVSPLGCGHESIWKRLLNGCNGITHIPPSILVDGSAVTVAGFVPRLMGLQDGFFDQNTFSEELLFNFPVSKEQASFTQYAVYAADIALAHAELVPLKMCPSALNRAGVAIASGGIGSIHDIVESSRQLDQSYKKLSPYFVPKILSNLAAGHVSIKHRFGGPITSVATACAAGTHSIGDAFNYIRMGYADVMLAGGTESSITPLSIAGFSRMRALSNSSLPKKASRPFDTTRDGFVMSEGAGVLVLEELAVAQNRGAVIIAEILGYGLSGDAHHPTHPSTDGSGAERSMRQALDDAGLTPNEIGYINAHATSTPIGDEIEVRAIERVFENRDEILYGPLFVSSTKGATGHLLGAAGAVETAFTAFSLRDGVIPPTLNLDNLDVRPTAFHHVPNKCLIYDQHEISTNGKKRELNFALKNSFGFGGSNASLVLSKFCA